MEKLAIEGGKPVRTKPFDFGGIIEIGDLEKQYVMQALEGNTLFRFHAKNSFSARLEQYYQEKLSMPCSLAVNSGTSALICALAAAGIGPGDEVVVPAYTYIATAAAVVSVGAVPLIAECDDTLNMDPASLKATITPYTKAVIVVHMKGVMAQMNELVEVAKQHNLIVIEDVAQANGGVYFGKPLGTIGDFGCFSLQSFKIITAGEGGMVVTRNKEWISRARYKHDAGYQFWDDEHNKVPSFAGENFRMSEINGALAFAQVQKFEELMGQLRRNKKRIVAGLKDIEGIQLQRVVDPEGDCSITLNFFLETAEIAQKFSDALNAEGIPNGTMHNGGFADRHIYCNWDYILEKRAASPVGTPWNCSEYKGNVAYDKNMCPQTLNYLGRAISIGINQKMQEEDSGDLVHAIQKVAAHYLKK